MKDKKLLALSKGSYLLHKFSHIYIEDRAAGYPAAQEILKKFPFSIKVTINHYKDLFNRPHQNFLLQKESPKLILAVKDDPYLYKGSEICENFGNTNFYYTSVLLNCIYHCDYCYLQGLYSSANIVVFVNMEDFFRAVKRQLLEGPLYLTTSYDSDLLAFEGVIPYASQWIEFAKAQKGLLVEIRTKSAGYGLIQAHSPTDRVILAWTLSPDEVTQRYEKRTPSLDARLNSIRMAASDGWRIRLSLEPIIRLKGWREIYGKFVDKISEMLPDHWIGDINIGAFRMSRDHFKKIEKSRTDTDIFCLPMKCVQGVMRYEEEEEMLAFLRGRLKEYYSSQKIYG